MDDERMDDRLINWIAENLFAIWLIFCLLLFICNLVA